MMNTTIKKRIEEINSGRVPERYEKTSFGIFPCDWEKSCLGDLFNFSGGLGKSREELGDKGACYLHYGDMHVGDFNKVSYSQYLEKPKYNTKITGNETFLMKDGDIAFLDASEDLEGTSRAVLIDNPQNEPFIAGLHTILAKEKVVKLSKFYKQYITIPNSVKKQFQKLASGFKVYGINRDTIKKIEIVYPKSSQEQSRIAEILMQWDKAIELQEKYIKQLELRKKALMQKLLTPKEGWKEHSLGEVSKIEKGDQVNNLELSETGCFPMLNGGVAPSGYYYKANCKANTITISEGGNSCGYVNYMTEDFWSGGHCYTLSHVVIEKYYLFAYLKHIESKIMQMRVGSGLPNIQRSAIEKIKIYYPASIEEQKSIAEIFFNLDKIIVLQTKKLDRLIKQRKALQQYLLTGIVRV